MSGRRRQGISPTLFPFLAVLVCTLGTLILLLALVSQKASEAAAASVAQAAAPADAELAGEPDQAEAAAQATAEIERQLREAKWYREQTVKMRDEQTAELEQRRDQLAHLEDHLARLREQLRLLTAEVEASLENQGTLLTAQATLDQLLTEIEDEQAAIGQLEAELQSQTPRIVIVPHKGPNGTDRRPIYVQCRSDGVYLQPGGQRIGRAQLEASSTQANPLDAALRAIRLHAMQSYGDAVAPYPLLIVSPDGIETYGLARAAMNSWDDQFGYELVPEGTELAFPAADPVLEDKVAAAIGQAVAQQEAFALRAGGRGRGGNAAGDSGSGGSPRAASLPVLSAAEMARGGLPAGTPVGAPQRSSGSGGASGYAAVNGSNAAGSPARDGSTETGSFGEYGSGNQSSGRDGTGGRGGTGETATGGDAVAAGMAQPGTAQPGTAQSGSAQGGAPQASPQPGAEPPAAQPEAAALAGQNMNLNPPVVAGAAGASSASTTGQRGGRSADQMAGQSSGSAGGATAAVSSGTPGGPGGPQAAGNQALAGSVDPQQAAGAPSISLGASPTPPVTRVGKDWGLPSSLISSRGTEMLRTIRVECHPDRFVLLPEGGRGANRTFAFTDGDVDRATLELATAVRDRAAGWGAAMQGARWQPVLDVAVVSGGESRYQQLLQLMDGSGVIIQARGTR